MVEMVNLGLESGSKIRRQEPEETFHMFTDSGRRRRRRAGGWRLEAGGWRLEGSRKRGK